MGFGMIGMALLCVLIIVAIVVPVRWTSGAGPHSPAHSKSALDVLEERYARSEIDKQEFAEKKRDLDRYCASVRHGAFVLPYSASAIRLPYRLPHLGRSARRRLTMGQTSSAPVSRFFPAHRRPRGYNQEPFGRAASRHVRTPGERA